MGQFLRKQNRLWKIIIGASLISLLLPCGGHLDCTLSVGYLFKSHYLISFYEYGQRRLAWHSSSKQPRPPYTHKHTSHIRQSVNTAVQEMLLLPYSLVVRYFLFLTNFLAGGKKLSFFCPRKSLGSCGTRPGRYEQLSLMFGCFFNVCSDLADDCRCRACTWSSSETNCIHANKYSSVIYAFYRL